MEIQQRIAIVEFVANAIGHEEAHELLPQVPEDVPHLVRVRGGRTP
jgi:hypothetical protein